MRDTRVRVLYRDGGTVVWTWHETLIVAPYCAAKREAADLGRRGFKALLVPELQYRERGIPETYNADEYFPRRLHQGQWKAKRDRFHRRLR